MRITKNILLKELESFNPKVFENDEVNASFEKPIFFNENQLELNNNCLYVCELNSLKECILELKGYYFICVSVTEEAKQISIEKKCCIITVNDRRIKLGELFNKLYYIFYKYREWNHKLDELILKNSSIQELINESEDFFENPFFITDYALHVVGNTNTIPADNDYLKDVISRKTFSNDSIENFIKRGLLSHEDKFRYLTFIEPPNFGNCMQYVKSIYINNFKSATFIQYCINRGPQKSDIDLINYFVSKLELLFSYDENKLKIRRYMCDFFIIELLKKTYSSEDDLKKRAELMKMPYDGRYMLYKISFENYSVRAATYAQEILKGISPFYRIAIYEKNIVIINMMDNQNYNEDILKQKIEWIESFLEKYHGYLGIGGIFHSLKYVSDEYNKATAAINIGKIMDGSKRVYWYKDYFIYHILLSGAENVSLDSMYYRKLKGLIDMDKKDNTDNLNILKIFLKNDRNVTKTAKLVNLHRNSVLYRISKIEEILNVNLNSDEVRMRILLSFYALDLIKKMAEHGKEPKLSSISGQ